MAEISIHALTSNQLPSGRRKPERPAQPPRTTHGFCSSSTPVYVCAKRSADHWLPGHRFPLLRRRADAINVAKQSSHFSCMNLVHARQ